MKILMTGATGLIGKNLGIRLVQEGHQIVVITRNKTQAALSLCFPCDIVEHDLIQEELSLEIFQEIDAIVHLMGETIDGKWTPSKKKKILESRSLSSKNLLKNCPSTVQVIVTASGQGYYGDRQDDELTESAPVGKNFLAEVCHEWEKSFTQLQNYNLKNQIKQRVIIFRLGIVLTSQGGALKKLIELFQKNVGASLGTGDAWMSYIGLLDLENIFVNALLDQRYEGVFNISTEQPIQNCQFTQELCEQLNRLKLPNVPEFVLRLMYGEMADLVLASTRAVPKKLLDLGYHFLQPTLKSILNEELKSYKNGQSVLFFQQYIPKPIHEVFDFFSEAKNLEKITPPFLNFNISSISTPQIQKGTEIVYQLKIHGIPVTWKTDIAYWNPPYEFVDNQRKGPYSLWNHTHSFSKLGNGTLMRDRVIYKIPLGFLSELTVKSWVENDVQKIFKFRREVIHQFFT